MKTKKHFFPIIMLIYSLMFLLHFAKNKHDTKIINYMLLNIEAIAQNENDKEIHCWGIGSIDCPITYSKVNQVYIF